MPLALAGRSDFMSKSPDAVLELVSTMLLALADPGLSLEPRSVGSLLRPRGSPDLSPSYLPGILLRPLWSLPASVYWVDIVPSSWGDHGRGAAASCVVRLLWSKAKLLAHSSAL